MISVAWFGVRVPVLSHLMFVHFTFSSVWVAVWQSFEKKLPARLAICAHYLLYICII